MKNVIQMASGLAIALLQTFGERQRIDFKFSIAYHNGTYRP